MLARHRIEHAIAYSERATRQRPIESVPCTQWQE